MALVLLPCDLPSWGGLEKLLHSLRLAATPSEVVCIMAKIRDLCCISLDSDEDEDHSVVFTGLRDFLDNYCSARERKRFFKITLPTVVDLALSVKQSKPKGGLRYSLQQQMDSVTLHRSFIASLLGLSLLCAFPKRTLQSHPTLIDFSFSRFYNSLSRSPSQQARFRAILQYFDRFAFTKPAGSITFHRKVMPGREWLPIEAWLHSGELLSKVLVKEDGEIEDEDSSVSRTCFSSSRLGEGALESDVSQETLMFSMHPEMLAQCLWTECLEDNEALHIEGLQRISTLKESDKVVFDPGVPTYLVGHHNIVTICIDAEDYSDCPLKQYEEDNILRELNKSYLGYCDVYKPLQNPENSQLLIRRSQLKPIKDEVAPEKSDKKQYFTETVKAGLPTKNSCPVVIAMIPKKSVASKETTKECAAKDSGIQNEVRKELWPYMTSNDLTSNENVEFCVNSSEGEMSRSNVGDVTCRRRPSLVELSDTHKSIYKTCNSELDDFKSANSSLDVEDVLDTSNDISRQLFFDRLSKVLRKERTNSETESGYAVDLVLDSPDGNDDIQQRLVRESSRGFVLKSEENDQDFFSDEGLERERKWLKHFREKSWNSRAGSSLDKDNASRYSFSSDFTSDLEEKYDNGPDLFDESSEKDPIRSDIVAQFANRLLKRTFSDSYLRVADELGSIPEKPHQKDICMKSESDFKILLKYHSLDEEALCDNTYGIDCHKDADDLIQIGGTDDFIAPEGVVFSPRSPKVVTPPRMRRGSVSVKRAKQRSGSRPKQRDRSNSVPVALEATQILRLNSKVLKSLNTTKRVPRIIISQENTLKDTGFDINKNFENEKCPSLSADVVEGFSFTFAENLIEGILRNPESLRSSTNSLSIPTTGQRKGILKNGSSNDSISRSPTSSISEYSADEEDNSNNNNHLCRYLSLPLLTDDHQKMKPIATGNWGCGANQKGDPQLKALVQWVAASKAGAPYLIYFTKRDPSLKQLKAVIEAVSSKGWTVGQLTGAILTYCQTTIASILGTSPRLRKEQQSDLFQYIIGMPATEL